MSLPDPTRRLSYRPVGTDDAEALHAIWSDPEVMRYHFARRVWGRGYATEAARAWVDLALGPLELPRVVALAYPANRASTRVMEKIGMGDVRDVERYGETLVQYSLDRD